MTDAGDRAGQDEEDPLRHADVGETKTVRESKTLHGINFEPLVFVGRDRQGEARIEDVEIIRGGDGEADDVKITWEADLTKRLPARWDQANEPRTEAEAREARRKKWLSRAATFGIPVVVIGVVGYVSTYIINMFLSNSSVTINGEQLPTVSPLLPMVVLFIAVALTIFIGIRGGFPHPRVGRRVR